MKICSTCKIEKPLTDYYKHASNNDGHFGECKACCYQRQLKWKRENPDRRRELGRRGGLKHYAKNRERLKEEVRKYRAANPDKIKALNQKLWKANSERYRKAGKKWREANKDRIRAYKQGRKAIRAKQIRERRKTDINYKLMCQLRTRLNRALKRPQKKTHKAVELLGCSIDSFKLYLESKFESGMTWKNCGSAWHCDHIMPCAIFDLSKPEHQKRCFHFSNIQPLWAEENHRKSSKVVTNQFPLL